MDCKECGQPLPKKVRTGWWVGPNPGKDNPPSPSAYFLGENPRFMKACIVADQKESLLNITNPAGFCATNHNFVLFWASVVDE